MEHVQTNSGALLLLKKKAFAKYIIEIFLFSQYIIYKNRVTPKNKIKAVPY